ncbi:helix-turn-helix domain-containing protein [Alcaligenes aquatilis]|uniref:XRE family transcriptional regulator n=1 Tax=Alcaligenes aquatilis TaxID=323284 RepID=A0A3G2HQU5_9BURK|nr:helix-turn-helix transcriptional regulator [Alcaligenes aquatilis]AYN19500.1 XRE family transcriptional regulator [Alcaligenes aquatilis]
MQKRSIIKGRPPGKTTFLSVPAKAFGQVVRTARLEQDVAQETLAHRAGIERSHMGKIERGEHMPTLIMILRIAKGLNCNASELIAAMEAILEGA